MTPEDGSNLILALNSGSSSLKFGLFAKGENDEVPVLSGSATGIERDNGTIDILSSDGAVLVHRECIHESQVHALTTLANEIRIHEKTLPIAVGHRVVHGGPRLIHHQLITEEVVSELRRCVHFAPLHIPQSLALISSAQAIFKAAKHFACFDNTFHRTLPPVAHHLALPEHYLKAGVRRYGFHGLSYASIVHHFGPDLPSRAVFAHLGNGASLCALRMGKSVDTTMGFTPTGGIPMGTRSGDIDPGVLLFLLRNERINTDELEEILNHASGLFALAGHESDVKVLEQRSRDGDANARLALNVFAMSVRKVIGSYIALLGGLDLLVFTGGIGENSRFVRSLVVQGLEALSVTEDKIRITPSQEEAEIARICRALLT